MQLTLTTAPNLNMPSPQLFPVGQKNIRLIDAGFLGYEASVSGFAERYGRGETSHAIHVWWARRPHSAMRALAFACLCKESRQETHELLTEIGGNGSVSPETLKNARNMLKKQYGAKLPKVLDMFGGGGTIPFEALNLGADTYSIDANQLSVFLQRCNLSYLPKAASDFYDLLSRTGETVLTRLEEETSPLFPLRSRTVGKPAKPMGISTYLWSYSHTCPACEYEYFVSKRRWVTKKKGKNLGFHFSNARTQQRVALKKIKEEQGETGVWVGRNGTVQCPKCKNITEHISIDKCHDALLAVVRLGNGSGKSFEPVLQAAIPPLSQIKNIEETLLQELGATLPESQLPRWSGIVNPALYGIKSHADFVNPRQRAVLLSLIKILRDEYKALQKTEKPETAKTIIGLLSALIDQLVDWNCRLSMWIPQNEQVGRAFCGPGVSMLWDYAETDPVSLGPANLWSKLERIIEGAKFVTVPSTAGTVHVQHAYAQSLPFEAGTFDAIITDPPYYDNIYYTVLADFFFAWKRLLLFALEPELFSASTTDDSRELVASARRHGSSEEAHEQYCAEFGKAISEAARVLKDDGVFALVYSHSSIKGWEAFITAYCAAPLMITSVQPLSIERRQRPRAMNSEAVNTCVAFVARKFSDKKRATTLTALLDELGKMRDGQFASALISSGWNETDAALAVYANGVALLANSAEVEGHSLEECLHEFEKLVSATFPTFSMQKRGSL